MEKKIRTKKIPPGERPVMEVVWENVERYRKEKGMTITEMCSHIGYAQSNYHVRIKEAGGVSPSTIQKFAWILEVKTIDLFEDWSE